MDPILLGTLGSLAASLASNYITKGKLDKRQLERDFKAALHDAGLAFCACVPGGTAIADLAKFFESDIMAVQCQGVLENKRPDLDAVAEAFVQEGYSFDGFEHRQAIQEFFFEFIESAGRKKSFIGAKIARLKNSGYKRRYLNQVVRKYEVLDFSGVPDAYDERSTVKLEEIFIKLQTTRRIPAVDILHEDDHRPDPPDPRRLLRDLMRERIETVSVVDALKGKNRMVVLGAPGAGKTTFMRYLALTFARHQAKEELDLDEERLPILVRLQDIAGEISKNATIADALSKHINSELQSDLPDDYFQPFLEAGRCIVLLDGLDEVANIRERGEVAKAVAMFANRYKANRYVVTSRIAGYREVQGFAETEYPHFTIRDFDDGQVKDFSQKWYLARRRNRTEAARRADDLIGAIERNPKVKQLATNPLMLTIIAIVHRSSAELPNERIKLYDKCTDALLYTWQREHNRPALTDIQGRLIRDTEVRRRLEGLARWMHSESPGTDGGQTHVRRGRLQAKLAEQLIARKQAANPDDAEDEATAFLQYIRQTTGVLLEHGTELYGFVHLTFQEYFAACDIYRRCGTDVEKVWAEISPHLHEGHWREVILLLIAKLSEFDEIGEELIQRILNAESLYEDLLRRDLLLAAACLADDVTVNVETYQSILDKIISLVIYSPYSFQSQSAIDLLIDLGNTHYKTYVMDSFTNLLAHRNLPVRQAATLRLGQIGYAYPQAVDKLAHALSDTDPFLRKCAALGLGEIGSSEKRIVDKLIETLSDEHPDVRSVAAQALGDLGPADKPVVEKLTEALSDRDFFVRWMAAQALGKIGSSEKQVVDGLIETLSDSHAGVGASIALKRIGQSNEHVVDRLLETLNHDDSRVRWGVVKALGDIEPAEERVVEKLIEALFDNDSTVLSSAAVALQKLGRETQVMERMRQALSDKDPDVRSAAAFVLGRLEHMDTLVVEKLIEALNDESPNVRGSAAGTLGQVGQSNTKQVLPRLAAALSDDVPDVRGAVAGALGRIGQLDSQLAEKLAGALSDGDSKVRERAAEALGQIGQYDEGIIEPLVELLCNREASGESAAVSWYAAEALGKIGQVRDDVIQRLTGCLSDENLDLRARAAYSLVQFGILDERMLASLEDISRDDRQRQTRRISSTNQISIHHWAFEALWRHAPLQIGDVPLRPDAPPIERIVRQEVQSHFEIEKGVLEIVWLKEGGEGEIRLIEINPETLSTGSIQAFSFAPSQDVPFPVRIADVTPDEWKQVQRGEISLPPGWSLQDKKIFRRSRG